MMSLFSKKKGPADANKSAKESTGKVVAILNQKGGVGKTTMTFHLAHALAKQGKKILAIDFDPQSNLTLLFGHRNSEIKGTVFQLLLNSLKELRPLHTPLMASEIIIKGASGVDLLPSSQDLSGFELTVAGIQAPRQLILKNFIEKNGLRDLYDFILIDGPPTLGLLMVNILCASQGVMIPFQADQFSRAGLEHFHQVLEDVSDMGLVNAPKVIGYVPNLLELRRRQGQDDFERIKVDLQGLPSGNLGAKIFNPIANRAQLSRLGGLGKSVFDYEGKEYHELQGQFREMAGAIIEQMSWEQMS